jgi:hypothetical protein
MSLASLTVKIGADISELEKAMGRASKAMEETGKRMSDLGKTLSTRVTAPIVAMGALSVRAFGIQEKAELQLRAALSANGREVDKLFGRYNAFAQEMQRVTVVGDETTLAMLAQAESMGLTGQAAQRAVKNSIAMQSAFGVSAERALRYTAALEQGEATMLRRYIPALRGIEDSSEMAAEAQRILTGAFATAEAEAQGSAGQITQLRNAVGDLSEQFGAIIADRILPFVKRLKELAIQFQGLNTIQKEQIVLLASIAAGIGPVLFGLGKITLAVRTLTTAMIANPFMAIAVGVLAISTHVLLANRRLSRMNDLVRQALDMPVTGTREELDKLNEAIAFQEELISRTTKMHEDFGTVGSEAYHKQLDPMKDVRDALIDQRDQVALLQLDHKIASESIIDDLGNQEDASKKTTTAVVNNVRSIEVAYLSLKRVIQEVNDAIKKPVEKTFSDILKERSAQQMGFINVDTEKLPTAMRESLQRMEDNAKNKFDILSSIANDFTSSFGQGMANVVVQAENLIDALKNIGKLLLSSAIQKGLSILLTGGLAGGGFFGGGGGLLGNLIKKVIPVDDALITSGGNVVKFHPDDNILAMKDFSKLGAMGGGQRVEVFGKISGQDIFISSDRGGSTFNR